MPPQRQLEEMLRSDENFAHEMAARYELGIEEGNEKGIEKGKLETSRQMKEFGDTIEKIIVITELFCLFTTHKTLYSTYLSQLPLNK